jgi:hypothetical protein
MAGNQTKDQLMMKKLMMVVAVCAAVGANGSERPDCFVEWIGATCGGRQYINTGYVFKSIPRVEAHARRTDAGDCDQAGTPYAFFNVNYAGGGIYYRCGSSGNTWVGRSGTSVSVPLNQWTDYVWSTNVVHDGVEVGYSSIWQSAAANFANNTQVFYLFAGVCVRKVTGVRLP